MDTIIFSSASEITKQIRDRKISCFLVAQQFLNHIHIYNKTINAISDLRSQESILNEAKTLDELLYTGTTLGPLHGLPITVKDSFHVKGMISSNGNPNLKKNHVHKDSELIIQLKKAGAIIIGKTNLALYALDWQSTNSWFGQTNNPYNIKHVVGGSSGGSAASLAAGFTALELGSDIGGSIRVPAHFCGVCGIRTTASALSNRGNLVTPGLPRLNRSLMSNGPFAKNVTDLILMLEVLWPKTQQHSENPPVALKKYEYKEEKLNIAFSKTIDGLFLDEEYASIYNVFLNKIQSSKHHLTEEKPSYSSSSLIKLWGRIVGFDFGAALKRTPFKKIITYLFMKTKFRDNYLAGFMALGASATKHEYMKSLELKDAVSDVFIQFFNKYDVWITPVSLAPAFKHQKSGIPFKINGRFIKYTKAFIPFNFPSTIPGNPIVVIPIGMTKKGLPVGVQIHGQKWQNYRLLQMAKELELLTDGFVIPKMFEKEQSKK